MQKHHWAGLWLAGLFLTAGWSKAAPADPSDPEQRMAIFGMGERARDIAYVAPGTLVIDGTLEDWDPILRATPPLGILNSLHDLNEGDPGRWQGPQDLSARIYAAWNETALYIAVHVTDDVIVPAPPGTSPWVYDAVEIFVDGRDPGMPQTAEPSAGCYQIGISPARDDIPSNIRVFEPGLHLTGMESATSRTGEGYIVEVKIPLTADNFPAGLWQPGRTIGLGVLINDHDDQGARHYAFFWGKAPGAYFRDTRRFFTLTLAASGRELYHPEADWVHATDPRLQALVHAGSLSKPRADRLAALGAPDTAMLAAAATGDNPPADRLDALWALTHIGNREAMAVLIAHLDAQTQPVAAAAAQGLAHLQRRNRFPALLMDPVEPESLVRATQVLRLAPDAGLQSAAIEACRVMAGDLKTIAVLVEKTASRDARRSDAAIRGLKDLEDASVFPDRLVQQAEAESAALLEELLLHCPDSHLFSVAVEALCEVSGTNDTMDRLIGWLTERSSADAGVAGLKHLQRTKRFPALLRDRVADQALAPLETVLMHAPAMSLQLAALDAIASIDGESAQTMLRAATENKNWQIRKRALEHWTGLGLEPDSAAGRVMTGWPMWRYDAGRTAAAPWHALPDEPVLRWTRDFPPPRPAHPYEVQLWYDLSYEPVVHNGTLFVPSMVTDSVTALDIQTGAERWRFFAGGPVRFAPVAWRDRLFFAADDGYLYCLKADDGRLLWKVHGIPQGRRDRRVLGNDRLISLWPARGGPVLDDGVVYFAAGLWPSEGVGVHAVDAETGTFIWSNTDLAHIPESNWDHGIGFVSGLTPEGYLSIVGDYLVVPCGKQLPAFFDPATGTLQPYTMGWGGRAGLPKGTWFAAGFGRHLSHGGDLYDIARPYEERVANPDYGRWLYPGGWTRIRCEPANNDSHMIAAMRDFRRPVLTTGAMLESGSQRITAYDLSAVEIRAVDPTDRPQHQQRHLYPDTFTGYFPTLWEIGAEMQIHLKAGRRVYAGGTGAVAAIDPAGDHGPAVVWQAEIEGTVHRMLAADGMLFVVTKEGRLFAFGAPRTAETLHHAHPRRPQAEPARDEWSAKAEAVIETSGVRDGYALVLGLRGGRLVEELVRTSDLHVIAVDPDVDAVQALRERLFRDGRYGTRAVVLIGNPATFPFPPYLANLILSEDPETLWQGALARTVTASIFRALRPHGGVACLWGETPAPGRLRQDLEADHPAQATIRQHNGFVLLERPGPLPGAADWSHVGADAANTGASQDEIQPPFSMLWFNSHKYHKVAGQHKTRIAAGRMIMLEPGRLRAMDLYTGRKLWEGAVPVGADPVEDPLQRQRLHRAVGGRRTLAETTQFVALKDAIYLADGTQCGIFDAATGTPSGAISLPDDLEAPWENLRIWGDYLVGSSDRHVLGMNRHSGAPLWRIELSRNRLSLAVGNGRVFCAEVANLRRGEDETRDGTLRALDIRTGEVLWERPGGAMLRYSAELDVLVTPMGFYRGADGSLLHQVGDSLGARLTAGAGYEPNQPYGGMPGFVAGRRLVTGNAREMSLFEIPSGKRVGYPLAWERRGCTHQRPSKHLLTTRYHSNAAWIELEAGSFTPFLGLRPGCQGINSLYPAGGLFNMPNYSGGCNCNFSPMSVALVPTGAVEPNGMHPETPAHP